MDTTHQFTPSYPNQEGNKGQMRFTSADSALIRAINDLRYELSELRREQEEEKKRQEREEYIRFQTYVLTKLSADESGSGGVSNVDRAATRLGLYSGGYRKKNRSTL